MASASYISNTQINAISTGNWIANGIFNDSNQTVALDNVNITVNGHDEGGNGLSVYRGGSITNKGNGQVSMTGGGILASMGGGSVDLYNATITVTDDPPTSNTASNGVLGFMTIQKNSSISLTDSKINSLRGNILISEFFGMSASVTTTANLDNVNLDDAKNQIISFYSSTLTVNLSNGTNFDGYSRQLMMGTGSFDINITTGASWNVTQDSTTGQAGSLSLGADSTISFVSTAGADTFANDFTNIHSAATMLAEGSILRLDKNAAAFEEGDIITLFTGASGASFTNNGALMMTADGQQLEYLDLDNGMFQIIGFLIPEPSTTTLGLAALGLLVFRRRVP